MVTFALLGINCIYSAGSDQLKNGNVLETGVIKIAGLSGDDPKSYALVLALRRRKRLGGND